MGLGSRVVRPGEASRTQTHTHTHKQLRGRSGKNGRMVSEVERIGAVVWIDAQRHGLRTEVFNPMS